MMVRQVVGKKIVELEDSALTALIDNHGGVLMDLGTGDGKHAVAWARSRPDRLVIGVDASATAMQRLSLQMAKSPEKGGRSNILFVWAAVENLPMALANVHELRSLMPWGSLLRGLLEPNHELLLDLGMRCRSDAPFTIVINRHAWHPIVTEVAGIMEPCPGAENGQLASDYEAAGWTLEAVRAIGPKELSCLSTSWYRRLRSSRDELNAVVLEGRIRSLS